MESDAEDMSSGISSMELIATLAILSVVSLVGIIGNALVIFVYAQKNDKQTATLFILILASTDLVVCLVIVPFTIFLEAAYWHLSVDFLCKSYFVMSTTNTIFGSVLISAIAVDRYLCICHPFSRIMTVPRARCLVSILFCLSFLLGCAPISTMRVVLRNDSYLCIDDAFVATAADNSTTDNSNGTSFNWTAFVSNVGHKAHSVTFTLCILTVTILYLAIFQSIRKVRQKKQTLKGIRLNTHDSGNTRNGSSGSGKLRWFNRKSQKQPADTLELEAIVNPSNGSGEKPIAYDQETGEAATTQNTFVPPESPPVSSQTRRISLRFIKDTQTFQNFRTAAMLFIVAIIYILTFLPASLMSYKFVDFNLPVFNLYFLNNAANPVVYSFLNRNFRDDIRMLMSRRRGRNGRPLTSLSVFSR